MKIGVTPDTATDLLPLIEDADDARQFARQYLGVWMQLPWYQQSWLAAGFEEADLDADWDARDPIAGGLGLS